MPLFSSATPFDGDVEKATNEMNTTEDWAVIMDICDKVNRTTNGPKDCLKSIIKRMNHKVPHVAMQSLIMLDACVNNCGKQFHLEVASRDFISEARTLMGGKAHPKVALQLKQLIKKWAEGDFKLDPSLNLVPTMYQGLLKEGQDFTSQDPPKSLQTLSSDPNVVSSQQEEDDIAKAIALSLKEGGDKSSPKTQQTSSLYPTVSSNTSSSIATPAKESRKVRALYDFEAAEDNELTFKAGEIIHVMDESDANWWKGSNQRGEGLFPANFVTADLSVEPEPEKKKVQFNEEVQVKTLEAMPEVIEIEEEKIDKVLVLIQNADPTGETQPDSAEMLGLEEQCKAMGPLIDQELEKIDRKHNSLMELNAKVTDALSLYHSLMKEVPQYAYPKAQSYVSQPMTQTPMFNGQGVYAPGQMAGVGGPMMQGQIQPQSLPSQGQIPTQALSQIPVVQAQTATIPGQSYPSAQPTYDSLPNQVAEVSATVTSYGIPKTVVNQSIPAQAGPVQNNYVSQPINTHQQVYQQAQQQPLL